MYWVTARAPLSVRRTASPGESLANDGREKAQLFIKIPKERSSSSRCLGGCVGTTTHSTSALNTTTTRSVKISIGKLSLSSTTIGKHQQRQQVHSRSVDSVAFHRLVSFRMPTSAAWSSERPERALEG